VLKTENKKWQSYICSQYVRTLRNIFFSEIKSKTKKKGQQKKGREKVCSININCKKKERKNVVLGVIIRKLCQRKGTHVYKKKIVKQHLVDMRA